MATELDMVKYEIFRHRLFNILEEGRVAIGRVSGSPVVVEGGETMCAFYAADGTPIITAAGVLLHALGARDFVVKCIEWYEEDPGIFDGDQFFFNDPYLGGQHLADMVVIKPIFYQGKRIAWTGSIMHTPETGGLKPGGQFVGSTEIYHEGIRIPGLKVVEKGKFRPDVFNALVKQVRDPHLVGLDTKGKIAGNNVCAKAYLQLVEKFGLEFVEAACKRIIDDAEKEARDILRRLPNGTWRARLYVDTTGIEEKPLKIMCTMTKKGEELNFDLTGSSPQVHGNTNSTMVGTWGDLFVVLCSQLFWNVAWNGGMFAPVRLTAPEGSIVNCTYPAACGVGVITSGTAVTETAHECIAKMLYAAGMREDVTSGWFQNGTAPFMGGINQYGYRFSGAILDAFASGMGGSPLFDGDDTGGEMMSPSSNVSDVEIIELNIPITYLARRNATDYGGYGKHDGGMGVEPVYMVYGTKDLFFGLQGSGRRVISAYGMFGGYPGAPNMSRFVLNSDIYERFRQSKTVATFEDTLALKGEMMDVPCAFQGMPIKDGDIITIPMSGGGGYGDPLERDPERVVEDVQAEAIALETANDIYGVVLGSETLQLDLEATERRRAELRKERLEQGGRLRPAPARPPIEVGRVLCQIHEHLEIVEGAEGRKMIRCNSCGYQFCEPTENYKEYALMRTRPLAEVNRRQARQNPPSFLFYQEFICPGCATLLEVDTYCPELDADDPILWDIQIDM